MKGFPVTLGVLDEEVPKASVMRERCSGVGIRPDG